MNVAVRGNAGVGALTLLWAVEINNDIDILFSVKWKYINLDSTFTNKSEKKKSVHVPAHVS